MNWGTFGLRQRVILGVAVAGFVFLVAAVLGFRATERGFTDYVSSDISTSADLEASRVEAELRDAVDNLATIAQRSELQRLVNTYSINSVDGTGPIVASLRGIQDGNDRFVSLTVLGPLDGVVATTDPGYAIGDDLPVFDLPNPFGTVFGEPGGTGVLPIRLPIRVGPRLESRYAIVGLYSLERIERLLETHSEGSRTIEAHMATLRPDGDVEFITPLRFEPDAAFNKVVPGHLTELPIVQIANGSEGLLVGVNDYRAEPSILGLRTIDQTGWGLVVKIDQAEALDPIVELRTFLIAGIVISGFIALVAIWFLLRPVMSRARKIAEAAEAVKGGDYQRRINDPATDELSAVANAFDLAVESMESSLEEKGKFVAAVSHELRTPLTAVMGLSAALAAQADRFSDEEIVEFAGLINSGAMELATLVEDLLTAARMQAGSLVVQPVSFEIAELVETTIAELPPELGVKVRREAEPGLFAVADEVRVRQIVRNLITNAHKYGGDTIVVRTLVVDGGVCVMVSDNGDGVPPEFAERIFDPFERAHEVIGTTDSVGLGLNIAKELAQRMGGDLAYRREGDWTVFDLQLPLGSRPEGGDDEPVVDHSSASV